MRHIWNPVLLLLIAAVSLSCGCMHNPNQPLQQGLQLEFDMPADYEVTEADWVDNERHKVGWPLGGTSFLRGKTIKERNGIFPIHIMRSDVPEFEGDPILVDDLLLGVNGMPLGKDGVDQIASAVKHATKMGRPVTVTRWRDGTIETVTLDFRLLQKGFAIPDLTKGGKPDETRDWTLGPIGANGWGFSQNTAHGGSEKARQLLITLVDADGPAAGKLTVGDVVIGVDGKKFARDARRALADAVNEAEKEENEGVLSLLVWRPSTKLGAGRAETLEVQITLPVMGACSETSPFNCPKTDRIINNGVAYVLANKDELLKPGWIGYINGLGLMATGRADVMPAVKELAHASILQDGETLSVEKHVSMECWRWSYKTLFLCEYYLLTRDESVLTTIEEYATKIAMGQSGAGTWGHTYAARENTGYLHGHLGGYGAINQMGLTLMIALPLAEKCGVRNKEVLDAIQRGDDFFSYFIGKGTIPYGDHGAAAWFDDNGKSGAAAILFDLLGNDEGMRFFSEMVLASTPGGREAGHTGHFWSHLWGGIGAARGGDKSLQVFMKEMEPIFTLERQHNGRFAFQDNVGEKGDQGKPKAKWDCTGARLLQLCVPRRKLYITGRETPRETHLTAARIKKILKAGRLDVDKDARAKLTESEIFELLADPLSPARAVGVRSLEEREINCVDKLMALLDSENRFARYGAAEALGRVGFGSKEAADKLIRMMEKDGDTQFRVHAIAALTNTDKRLGLASVAQSAIPVLLRMAIKPADDDPRKVLQNDISRALFYSERAQARRGLLPMYGLDGVDRSLLVPAVREILTNKNGAARSTMTHYIYPLLSKQELEELWGDIYLATRYIAPSGIMFASEARTDGLKLMAQHHVKEGMYLAAWYLRWQKGHGAPRRLPAALTALESYGADAKPLIPYLEEHVAYWEAGRDPRREVKPDDPATRTRATIEKIRNAADSPDLISISKYIDKNDIPPRDGP